MTRLLPAAGAVLCVVLLSGCTLLSPQAAPVTVTATVVTTATATPTPSPQPTEEPPPAPDVPTTPPEPLPPTRPNDAGGQTDGGNTPNTPWVEDTGPAPYADGPAEQVNDYEYRYTVTDNDTVLAIASRFQLQTADVVRVNFPCTDPLAVQPGDVLDIRWPLDTEVLGSGPGC
jgi:hypothetical protein